MFRTATGLCVALMATGVATAQTGSTITALRNQIKVLRAQESGTIRAIQAIYRAIRRRDQLTDSELRLQRAALKKQEDTALALTSDSTQKAEIRQLYGALRRQLTVGLRLTDAEIRALSTEESVLVRQVRALYTAQINLLQQQLRVLERSTRRR
jgi:hypothetical protein